MQTSVIPRVYCNPNYSYIIVGGLGGFGLELANWLVIRGCKKLILSSSRGVKTSYQTYRIKLWKLHGTEVEINTDDISTQEGCNNLIKKANKIAPVGGIFNLAVHLSDSILENQSHESFTRCMAPKAVATKFIDKTSRKFCPMLKYFVVFSSVACGYGNAGQSNYGMANSAMERIIEQRRKDNLPGKAIQWGPIGDVGVVGEENSDKFEVIGASLQKISSCLEELDFLMLSEFPIVASMVLSKKVKVQNTKRGLIETIANIMSIKDIKTLSMESKLSELGMDSLMTVEITQVLEREFNLSFTPPELRSLTLSQLENFNGQLNFQDQNIDYLLNVWGDETKTDDTIITLESQTNCSGFKALIVPGIEGVGGNIFVKLAKGLNYPTYLLQFAKCWNAKSLDEIFSLVIDDVIKFYQNDDKFILIGFSYGALITLKLAKSLENLGKMGKIYFVDGAPELLKRLVLKQFPADDENIQKFIIEKSFKKVQQDDKKLEKVLVNGWEGKLLKIDELYNNFNPFSKKFVLESLSAIYNRIKIILNLDLKSFEPFTSTPMTLIKPSTSTILTIDDDYGLKLYSPSKEIKTHVVNGNHLSMLESADLIEIINNDN